MRSTSNVLNFLPDERCEGEGESEGRPGPPHTAGQTGDGSLILSELPRVIQLHNTKTLLHCDASTEGGYAPGTGEGTCTPHVSDYYDQDWRIRLGELLRVVQFYSFIEYHVCDADEDSYCKG